MVISPTRELAQQIAKQGEILVKNRAIKQVIIHGGVAYETQKEDLSKSPEIIIATPGRLLDLLDQKIANVDNLQYFILDEVDQMLDLGFYESIMKLASLRNKTTQTLAFSATAFENTKSLLKDIAPDIKTIELENQNIAVENIQQTGYFVEKEMMKHLLVYVIRTEKPEQAIVFTRSKNMANELAKLLLDNKIAAEAIHSEKSQAAREYILERFKNKETQILVATDLIARGIHIDDVSHIINYGLPQDPQQYIHRIGRTARAGKTGKAITLCIPEDTTLLSNTCKLMKQQIKMETSHPYHIPPTKKGKKKKH